MARNPLEDLRAVHEGEYFAKREKELIEKLRSSLQRDQAAREIATSAGIDQELAGTLAELGIEADTLPLMHLLPLIVVAWASGRVEPEERALIELAAHQSGVDAGHPAWPRLQELFSNPPDDALYEACLRYHAAATPQAGRESMVDTARSVAAATGGVFGLFGNVEPAERDALQELAHRLNLA
jgi:hypothetical protein